MINRPPTRIELKLEDDFIEYQQMEEIRKRKIEIAHLNPSPNIKEPFELGPEDYEGNKIKNQFSPFTQKNKIKKINKNNEFQYVDCNVSNSNTSDIAID